MRKLQGLPSALSDAAHAYLDALPPGDIVAFPITGIDRIGLPIWVVAYFPEDARLDAIMPYGIGYGETDEQAILGSLGEIAEMVFPELSPVLSQRTRGSWTELVRALGEGAVADPLRLCLPAGSFTGRDTVLEWLPARRARTGATVLVPIELALYSRNPLAPGYRPFTPIISNGMGAGPDTDFALAHGVLELLQRDGNGLLFRALDQGVLLTLPDTLPPAVQSVLGLFDQAGITILPKFASDEWGFCNLYCVGYERAGRPAAPIMLSACGEACHLDREQALLKSLTEFAASRARKTFAHGPASFAEAAAPPGYVGRFLRRSGSNAKTGDARAVTAMRDWTARSADQIRAWLAGNMHAVHAHKPFDTLPERHAADARANGALAITHLEEAGLHTLYVDHAPPGAGISVVKAIVPGLEVETMSFSRIGARNTRKLLDRGHDLIRFGTASDTLRPVRLTPEALDEFGGQPLFDKALAERIVGPLYPLYREPEAHHVAAVSLGRVA